MYKHILAAVDDSETSNRALIEAIRLTRNQRATLTIVYVLDKIELFSSATIVDPNQSEKGWEEIAHDILSHAWDTARKAGIKAETRLLETKDVEDRVAQAILDEVRVSNADLIIAGTHGRTGLKRLLMGSVSSGLVRHTPVPILLIRQGAA